MLHKVDAQPRFFTYYILVRPQKWEDSQVGFRGSNASGGRIVLLPGAFWAHGASKMVILGASLLLYVLQHLGAQEGMLPPGACRTSCASARRIVSCRGLCASSLCSQIPLVPAPTFGVFRYPLVVRSIMPPERYIGHTPQGPVVRSKHLLETPLRPFQEPLLRALLRTLLPFGNH